MVSKGEMIFVSLFDLAKTDKECSYRLAFWTAWFSIRVAPVSSREGCVSTDVLA